MLTSTDRDTGPKCVVVNDSFWSAVGELRAIAPFQERRGRR